MKRATLIIFSIFIVITLLFLTAFNSFSSFYNEYHSNNYTLILDEFYVFNDALTQNEIEELYRGGLRVREVQVNDVTLNISSQTAVLNLTLPYVSSIGGDVEYEVYYSPR
ncbi:MAG: hypothetical protein LAT82_00400 [Nanoarchaeota archaeon]|nr:hypothetical protein [Nanoarchaeota archaeon]